MFDTCEFGKVVGLKQLIQGLFPVALHNKESEIKLNNMNYIQS